MSPPASQFPPIVSSLTYPVGSDLKRFRTSPQDALTPFLDCPPAPPMRFAPSPHLTWGKETSPWPFNRSRKATTA